jgi:hypothetical protein
MMSHRAMTSFEQDPMRIAERVEKSSGADLLQHTKLIDSAGGGREGAFRIDRLPVASPARLGLRWAYRMYSA